MYNCTPPQMFLGVGKNYCIQWCSCYYTRPLSKHLYGHNKTVVANSLCMVITWYICLLHHLLNFKATDHE